MGLLSIEDLSDDALFSWLRRCPVDVVYLEFSKALGTVSHYILIGNLRNCRMDEWTVRWTENWLNGSSQKVVVSGMEFKLETCN